MMFLKSVVVSVCVRARSLASALVVAAGAVVLSSCQNLPSVVLYTSVDEPYAAPIVRQFERQQGVRVRLVTDTEATKSIGLAERLRAERASPRCDVWWGNEPFNTALLAEEGLLAARPAEQLASTPEAFRDPHGRWAGNALRYRVLALPPDLTDEQQVGITGGGPITGLSDLLRAELKGKIALARPVAGTTMGHVAVMYLEWGPEKFTEFFRRLHAHGAVVLGGNSEVVKQVGAGNILLGLTDNDDVFAMTKEGMPVAEIMPDQGAAAAEFSLPGTVAIPTTVGLVVGRPENARARLLADFLLSSGVEEQLVGVGFAAGSVWDPSGRDGKPVRVVAVDYLKTAQIMPTAARLATDLLDGKEPGQSTPN